MNATITKVGAIMPGKEKPYQMVFFRLESGGSALTYLSPGMNNYKRWKPLLEAGAVLTNLRLLKDGKTIDADSKPQHIACLKQSEALMTNEIREQILKDIASKMPHGDVEAEVNLNGSALDLSLTVKPTNAVYILRL